MPRPAPLRPGEVAPQGPFRHDNVHARGIRLHAAHVGSKDAPLVVLLHDWPGAWFDFWWLIEPLSALGFHVAAVDFRGVGLSDKPPAGYDMMHAAGDVVGAVRSLGHENAVLVGVGSGASVAWVTAARYPEVVRGVVGVCGAFPGVLSRVARQRPWQLVTVRPEWESWLVGVMPRIAAAVIRRHPTQWAHGVTRAAAAKHPVSEGAAQRVEDLCVWRARQARVDPVAEKVVQWARVPFVSAPARWARPRVDCPVLLIVDGSPLWRRVAQALQRVAQRCESRVVIHGSRLPHVEAPAQFAQMVATFIRSL